MPVNYYNNNIPPNMDEHDILSADGVIPLWDNIRNLWVQNINSLWYKSWNEIGSWTQAVTGSGVVYTGSMQGGVDTSTTNPSKASIYANQEAVFDYSAARLYFRWSNWPMVVTTSFSSFTFWMGMFATPAAPTTTDQHIAFYAKDNANLIASNSDGTQKSTDTTVDLSSGIAVGLYFYYSADNIKFYTNDGTGWTLRATHTTNRPTSSVNLYPLIYIATTSTTAKSIWFKPLIMQQGQ